MECVEDAPLIPVHIVLVEVEVVAFLADGSSVTEVRLESRCVVGLSSEEDDPAVDVLDDPTPF